MTGDKILTASALPFPRWMKWAGLVIGFYLLSDGLRRLLSGGGMAAFFPCLLIGSACVFTAGYDKSMFLSGEGLVRRTFFWGRGKEDLLPWGEMEEIILLPSQKGTGAIFAKGDRGIRAFFPEISQEEIRAAAALHAPNLKISGRQ